MIVSSPQQTIAPLEPVVRPVESNNGSANVLDLIRRLCESLDKRKVSYVHWKSNVNIHQALSGVDDLDLLVSSHDVCSFLEILYQLDFREVLDPPLNKVPGIRHFYALDKSSGKLVHVHAHFQLVLGHDATKNYHLPIEKAVLGSADRIGFMPVPAPECELILYTVRMVLKFGMVRNVLRQFDRLGSHPELEHLESLADRQRTYNFLEDHLPHVDASLFDACLECIRPGTGTLHRYAIRRKLHLALAPFARRPRALDRLLKLRWRVRKLINRLLPWTKGRKRIASGGAIIAIVGGDGAGKTTVVEQLSEKFGKVFTTRNFHLGKPPRSWTTRLVRVVIQLKKKATKYLSLRKADSRYYNPRPGSLLWALRYYCVARDRYRSYRQARAFATEGGVVISDRWPLPELKQMDGTKPILAEQLRQSSRFVRYLRKRECDIYRNILAPDLLIVLRVHPDIAVARRWNEQEEMVRPRSEEVWKLDWHGLGAHVTDSSQPISDVVSEVFVAAWKGL